MSKVDISEIKKYRDSLQSEFIPYAENFSSIANVSPLLNKAHSFVKSLDEKIAECEQLGKMQAAEIERKSEERLQNAESSARDAETAAHEASAKAGSAESIARSVEAGVETIVSGAIAAGMASLKNEICRIESKIINPLKNFENFEPKSLEKRIDDAVGKKLEEKLSFISSKLLEYERRGYGLPGENNYQNRNENNHKNRIGSDESNGFDLIDYVRNLPAPIDYSTYLLKREIEGKGSSVGIVDRVLALRQMAEQLSASKKTDIEFIKGLRDGIKKAAIEDSTFRALLNCGYSTEDIYATVEAIDECIARSAEQNANDAQTADCAQTASNSRTSNHSPLIYARKKPFDFDIAKEYTAASASFLKRRGSQELFVRFAGLPEECGYEIKQSLANSIGKEFGGKARAFRNIDCISLSCEPKEAARLQELIAKSSCAGYGIKSLANTQIETVGRAKMVYLPGMLMPGALLPEGSVRPVRQRIVAALGLDSKLANLEQIDAYYAHALSRGKGISVGIIDTGVDYAHQEFKAVFGSEKGYDFIRNNDQPMDENNHGTHVAGIVAGEKTGVAPECRLYALRVLDAQGYGSEADVLAAIDWAIDKKLDIVNLSLGSPNQSKHENEIIKAAVNSGIVVVAAAGNESRGNSYPAAYDGVISVAAVDANNNRAYFSNVCDTLDISAPGVDVISGVRNGKYAAFSGTSMASPHVSGVVALIKSFEKNTKLNPAELEQIIKNSSLELGSESEYGAGLVKALAAVETAKYKNMKMTGYRV